MSILPKSRLSKQNSGIVAKIKVNKTDAQHCNVRVMVAPPGGDDGH